MAAMNDNGDTSGGDTSGGERSKVALARIAALHVHRLALRGNEHLLEGLHLEEIDVAARFGASAPLPHIPRPHVIGDELSGLHAEVFEVHQGLSAGGIAWEDVAFELLLVDPRNLLRNGQGMALLIVDTRDAQDHCRNRSALLTDDFFGAELGLRIRPCGPGRRLLRQEFSLVRRLHHEQTAGEDELLEVKVLAAQLP